MNSPFPEFIRIDLPMYATPNMTAGINGRVHTEYMAICQELISLGKYPSRNDAWVGPGHTIDASNRLVEKFG